MFERNGRLERYKTGRRGGPRLAVLRGYLKEGESTGVWDRTCCGVTPV
jgi:hypothetical protein